MRHEDIGSSCQVLCGVEAPEHRVVIALQEAAAQKLFWCSAAFYHRRSLLYKPLSEYGFHHLFRVD